MVKEYINLLIKMLYLKDNIKMIKEQLEKCTIMMEVFLKELLKTDKENKEN